jgi:benzylsuccinate CoA-transferase BbsF subunit
MVEQPWGRTIGSIAMHGFQTGRARPYNTIANFNEVNRAKLSIAINLAHERGKWLFRRLVSVSDVVIENYSPRVMRNLDLAYESLREVRPDVIMVSMPALGDSGPWTNYTSFGPGTDALAGLSDVTGYQGGPPHKPGNFYADQNAAFHVAVATMAALRQRRRTGRGQRMEVVLREATMAIIGEYFLEYQLTGRAPQRTGNYHPSMAPHNVYRCRGDDAWVAIAVASDEEWRRFRTAVGSPTWCGEDGFATASGRLRRRERLDRLVQGWTEHRTPYEVMHALQRHGVKAGAVLKPPEALEDPHYRERGFIDRTEHPEAGSYVHPGLPWKTSGGPHDLGRRAPLFAEHSDWVLSDLLSLDEDEVVALRQEATAPLEPADR